MADRFSKQWSWGDRRPRQGDWGNRTVSTQQPSMSWRFDDFSREETQHPPFSGRWTAPGHLLPGPHGAAPSHLATGFHLTGSDSNAPTPRCRPSHRWVCIQKRLGLVLWSPPPHDAPNNAMGRAQRQGHRLGFMLQMGEIVARQWEPAWDIRWRLPRKRAGGQ